MTSHSVCSRHGERLSVEEKEGIRKEWLDAYDTSDPSNSPLRLKELALKYGVTENTIRRILQTLPEFQMYLREYRKFWNQ